MDETRLHLNEKDYYQNVLADGNIYKLLCDEGSFTWGLEHKDSGRASQNGKRDVMLTDSVLAAALQFQRQHSRLFSM